MSDAIKRVFVVEWQGPFTNAEINEIKDKKNSGSLYLVSGLQRYQRGESVVQYIGISKRGAAIRFKDKEHKSELVPRERQYWSGHITNAPEKNESNLRLVEHALLYTCKPPLNVQNVDRQPHFPVIVVNRWLNKSGDIYRQRRIWPVQKDVPDIIMFDGADAWTCDKLIWRPELNQ